jgi:hypothetical protein
MVNPIMTETLPTIIGIGVVSRTTETMFDRRGRRIRVRGKSRPKSKQSRSVLKIHRGSRGGKYLIRHGRKIYI